MFLFFLQRGDSWPASLTFDPGCYCPSIILSVGKRKPCLTLCGVTRKKNMLRGFELKKSERKKFVYEIISSPWPENSPGEAFCPGNLWEHPTSCSPEQVSLTSFLTIIIWLLQKNINLIQNNLNYNLSYDEVGCFCSVDAETLIKWFKLQKNKLKCDLTTFSNKQTLRLHLLISINKTLTTPQGIEERKVAQN